MSKQSEFTFEQAKQFTNQVLNKFYNQPMTDIEQAILKAVWENKEYKDVVGWNANSVKNAAAELWHKLSIAIDLDVKLKNVKQALESKWGEREMEGLSDDKNNLSSTPGSDFYYIDRPPLEKTCYDAIVEPGGLIRITAPQKMGKNLLLNKVLDYAKAQNYQTVKVIFNDRSVFEKYETFIKWFCLCISDTLKPEKTIYEIWQDVGNHRNCNKYFEEILLPRVEKSLVIAMVDFEVLLEFPDIFRDFCSLIRTWYNNAAERESIWRKLRIVIVNSTKPYVKYDINRSPFNVGESPKLVGFTDEQVASLVKYHQLEQKLQGEEEKLKILITLVAGHPDLIQKALTHLKFPQNTIQELLDKASTEQGIFRDHLKEQLEALKKNPKLLEDYKIVINSNTPVRLDDDQSRFKLDSLGLIEFSGNDCVSSCNLYRNYFLDILKNN